MMQFPCIAACIPMHNLLSPILLWAVASSGVAAAAAAVAPCIRAAQQQQHTYFSLQDNFLGHVFNIFKSMEALHGALTSTKHAWCTTLKCCCCPLGCQTIGFLVGAGLQALPAAWNLSLIAAMLCDQPSAVVAWSHGSVRSASSCRLRASLDQQKLTAPHWYRNTVP